jgi:tetratricopeptide (TPR) repeat protein
VQELIAARLDRLGPWAKRVAQVAAVFGRQFRRDDLTRLLESEEIDVGVELEELERRGIIHRKDALSLDEFRFGESLTQEVAYESLLLRERRTLHERIAFLLDERLGESGEGAALVAHHFARSDNRAKAVETMLRAAEHAEKLPSYPAALGFYRDAWTIVSQVVGETGLGPVEFRMLARQTALGLCRFAVFYGAPDVAAAERAAQLGRALSEEANDPEGIATFYLFEGMILGQAPRDRAGSGLALIERGVAVAQAAGLDLVALNLSRGLAWGYFLDGRFEVARSMLESVVARLDELGIGAKLTDTYFGALFLRNMAAFHDDDIEGAAARFAETYELAIRAANRTVQAGSSIGLSWIHFLRGEYAEAKRIAERALEVSEAIGNAGMIRTAAALVLGARLELDTHTATGRYLDLIDQTVTAPSGDFGTRIHLLVEVLVAVDEIERARRLAEFAEDHGQGRYRQALSSLALGNVLLASGPEHWEAADDALHRAASMARELGSRSTLGLALLAEAELAAARGELPVAEARAGEAADLLAEIGYRRYEARARRLNSPASLEDERRDAVG